MTATEEAKSRYSRRVNFVKIPAYVKHDYIFNAAKLNREQNIVVSKCITWCKNSTEFQIKGFDISFLHCSVLKLDLEAGELRKLITKKGY